jgi:hypothetical protein
MRHIALLLGAAGFLCAQTLTEFGATAAGSTVGSAAGKKVSDGITTVFGKVDQQTAAAAGKAKSAPTTATVLEVGPGAPKGKPMGPATASAEPANGSTAKAAVRPAVGKSPGKTPDKNADNSMVPPPPPSPVDRRIVEPVRERAAVAPPPVAPVAPAPVAPPPPEVTLDDLKQVAVGEQRDELLRLGPPSVRISMWDDGHLLEIFSYRAKELMLGRVRLHDGTVQSVELR